MVAHTFDEAFTQVKDLVQTFQAHEADFMSPKYSETDVRRDFIDGFWAALGWDVMHETQKNPYEREVVVEKSVNVEGRGKRADYSFAVAPNYRDVRFFVEAKKPSRQLSNAQDYFQTIRYGWNARTPVAVLTDFEEFHILDCRYKPDVAAVLQYAALEKFYYTDYTDAEKFRRIYHLFSREAVAGGALESFTATLPKPGGRGQKRAPLARDAYQSIDESFLQELDGDREHLARVFKEGNPQLDSAQLTEITQRTLDRLVFMRFLEDKLIEPDELIEPLVDAPHPWAAFVAVAQRLNRTYNGIIFRAHAVLDADTFRVDEQVFRDICARLSHVRSVYNFDLIPIHILGSIYERFLGKTIQADAAGAQVVEKPEVRKAGGVYYTPEYVVRYIVENTVGRLISDKSAEAIRALRFADIACGSGSFLLGVYDLLLRHLTSYYNRNKRTRAEGIKAGCIPVGGDALRLSLLQKRTILLNNIYGVDVDAQAVEVAQLSLYLKLLEEETTATTHAQQLALREALLPSLTDNIKSGNSLVDWDITSGQLFEKDELLKLNPMSFAQEFPAIMRAGGFDAIVGNPPYIRIQTMQETTPHAVEYFRRHYVSASRGNYDIYVVFVERALQLLNERGLVGYILPHKFFNAQYGASLRNLIANGQHLAHVVHFGALQIFAGATTYTCLLFLSRAAKEQFSFVKVDDLGAWREHGTQAARSAQLDAEQVTDSEWNFAVGEGAALFARLSEMTVKLGDVADIFVGLQTSADDVFIMNVISESTRTIRLYSKALETEWTFERQLLYPLVSGTDVTRYALHPVRQFILFPYEVENETPTLIDFESIAARYPRTAEYLLANRGKLESRERGRFRDEQWYRFGRNQNIGIQQRVKLCVPRLVDHLYAALDAEGTHFLDNVDVGGITLRPTYRELALNYLLSLLNSRLLRWHFPFVSAPFRGGWLSANRQFLSQLPIRPINFSNSNERRKHDDVVALTSQMLAAKRELAGAVTERERGLYERKCANIDQRLDELVYELYGLTPEEVAIVEAG